MNATNDKTVYLCVNDDVITFLKWTLNQCNSRFNVKRYENAASIENIPTTGTDILIIDCPTMKEPPLSNLQKIRSINPSLNILLIVPAVINKHEAFTIIRERLVKGMLVSPFSAEVVCSYINKIVG
jgi:hypothetical protein